VLSSAKGQIRTVISKNGGIEIINELGDIEIKCRKLYISANELHIDAKNIRIHSGGELNIKCKNMEVKTGGEFKMKAQTVYIKSRNVTVGGKQAAVEGDKVMGFDIHQMEIPAGPSTAVAPLPHPYLGKLVDKLAKDVKINGHNAALKGSVSRHDSPVHNQLPGTIRFINNPDGKGEEVRPRAHRNSPQETFRTIYGDPGEPFEECPAPVSGADLGGAVADAHCQDLGRGTSAGGFCLRWRAGYC
jgi:uncharacterized Zn-binding protein involved in type VI secretion